jgi:hypothetical protein
MLQIMTALKYGKAILMGALACLVVYMYAVLQVEKRLNVELKTENKAYQEQVTAMDSIVSGYDLSLKQCHEILQASDMQLDALTAYFATQQAIDRNARTELERDYEMYREFKDCEQWADAPVCDELDIRLRAESAKDY